LCEDATLPVASGNPPTSLSPTKSSTIKGIKSSPSKVATKLKAREVPYEEAECWAKEEGLLFVETSAKSGLNVEQAFVDASRSILEKIKKGVFDDDRVSNLLSFLVNLFLINHSVS
jgi:Ras-related protein Rab-2A